MKIGTESVMAFCMDLRYEFSAPHFFDFCVGETEEEAAAAERWFQGALSHPASPLVGKVKSVGELSTGCSLEQYIEVQKLVARISPKLTEEMDAEIGSVDVTNTTTTVDEGGSTLSKEIGLSGETTKDEPRTPKDQFPQHFAELKSVKATHTAHNVHAKLNCSELHKQAIMKNIKMLPPSCVKPTGKRCLVGSKKTEETQVAKKQKIDGGHSCQVWNSKPQHVAASLTISQKFRLNAEKQASKKQKLEGGRSFQVGCTKTPRAAPTLTVPQEFHFYTEKRALIHKEIGQCSSDAQDRSFNVPYIPVAEMVQKFQTNILGEFRMQDKIPAKRRLTLTRPKEPMLGTSQRARPPTVKSFAQQEEELLANLPRFKARPLNKRILEGPTLLPPPRSTPQLPEFQEFNLRTMERALMFQHPLPSMDVRSVHENHEQLYPVKEEFRFETIARARPPKIKSTKELEQELATMSKFKARPINKRIFSSRGDVGVYTVPKRQATIPKEFHFATDQRAHYHNAIMMEQQNREFHFATDQRAHYHNAIMMEQQNQEQSLLEIERDTCAKVASEPNARISMLYALPNAAVLKGIHGSVENYGLQQRVALDGQTPLRSNVVAYAERNRKPLGEIQPHFVFGAAAPNFQQSKIEKMYVENNSYKQVDKIIQSHHVNSTLYPLSQVCQNKNFPVQTRPMKNLIQPLTPQMGQMMEERPPHKASFSVSYMR